LTGPARSNDELSLGPSLWEPPEPFVVGVGGSIDVVAVAIVPPGVRLHTVAVAGTWRSPSRSAGRSAGRSADRSAHGVAVVVALSLGTVAVVAGLAVSLLLACTAVVAAATAAVGAADVGLVGTHGDGAALVLAVNGGLEGADRVERPLPS
jgi:hypothetical protein